MGGDYSWRVMVSSTMRDLPRERQVAEGIIIREELTAWYAERPPSELTGSAYELSREMARTCDLYLLIIGSRYGSHPRGMPEDDARSVTHLEFDIAREANPRKVRVFLPKDIDAIIDPEHPNDFRAFVAQVTAFRNGYDCFTYNRDDLRTLEDEVRHAIEQWRDTAGHDAYCLTLRDTYSKERNPVTGAEMDADATVLLKLRTGVAGTILGVDWDEQLGEEDRSIAGGRAGRRGSGSLFGRGERHGRREAADERIRVRAQPIIKLASEFLTQFGRLVLLGEVGAGKSTLLRRLAYDLARDALAAQDDAPRRIPVLVRAADLGKLALERSDERWSEVVGLLAERLTANASLKPLYRATVANALNRGEALLLVDGLDEAQPAEQQAVFALLRQVGANQTILASRPAAYREELTGASWRVCQAQRLDPTQRHTLIAEVFRVVRESAEGGEAAGSAPDPAALERELDQRDDLFTWAGNPLLLTLVATQYARDARLPESRARIYQFAIEDMRRQRSTTARRYFTEEELNHLQRALALRMTEAGARLTTLEEARDRYLGALLRDLTPETTPAMLDICAREVLERSGVLQRADAERWEFVHLSFREYLAACALATMPRRDRWVALRNRTLSAQWEQVFFLLINRLDTERQEGESDALIRSLITRDGDHFPALGGRDSTHTTLRLATRLYFRRSARSRIPALRRTLVRRWRPLWRRALRMAATGATLQALLDAPDDVINVPNYFAVGAFLVRTHSNWILRYIPRNWLVFAFKMTTALLGVTFVVVQVFFSITLLRQSAVGHWIGEATPEATLALLLLLIFWRVLLWRRHVESVADFEVVQSLADQKIAPQISSTPIDQPDLHARLKNHHWEVRQEAALALAGFGTALADDPVLVDALLDRLGDNDPDVRQAAAQALAAIGPALVNYPALIDKLLARLEDLDNYESDVRLAAAQALAAIGPALADHPILFDALLAHLNHHNRGVRQAAALALVNVLHGNLWLTLSVIQRVQAIVTYPSGFWKTLLLAAIREIRWLCDWPVLVCAAIAQLLVIWPVLTQVFPLPQIVQGAFALTAWWQILLITLGYLIVNTLGILVFFMDGVQIGRRNHTLKTLEALIVQIDDNSQRLKSGSLKQTQ